MVRGLRLRRAILLATMRGPPARACGHRGGRQTAAARKAQARPEAHGPWGWSRPQDLSDDWHLHGLCDPHFTDFYDLENVLILGRVTSGPGGDIIIAGAKEVLKVEFPELTGKIAFHIPSETDKRHGQAVAAASLPKVG